MRRKRMFAVGRSYTREVCDGERMAGEHQDHAPSRGMIDDALRALDADHDAGLHVGAGTNDSGCCNRCGRWVA
jgi:hypothetical protein